MGAAPPETLPIGLTPRALLIGVLAALAICVVVPYGELVLTEVYLGASHLPPAALGGFLIIIGITRLPQRRMARLLRLSASELILVYVMMIVAAILSSFGLTEQLLAPLVGVNYFATPENRYAELFFPHIKPALVPWDPHGPAQQPIAVQFYEGLRAGERIPWGPWLRPLLSWSVLALLLFWAMLCLGAILRRQWIERDRLTFPLVQLPLELVRGEVRGPWLLALGFAVPFLIHSLNGLHSLFPAMPEVRLTAEVGEWMHTWPWTAMYWMPITGSFAAAGFAFLLPADVSFSFWFFFLWTRAEDVIAAVLGIVPRKMPVFPTRIDVGYQGMGAFFVLAGYLAWTARDHLRAIGRAALGRAANDADEPLPFRVALWGLIAGLIGTIVWCWWAGLNLGLAALLMIVFLLVITPMIARTVSEAGLPMIQGVFRPEDTLTLVATPGSVGLPNMAVLAALDTVFLRDQRGALLPTVLDGLRMAEGVRLRRRSLFAAMGIAIVLTMAASYLVQLRLIYQHGGVTLRNWFLMNNPTLHYNHYLGVASSPKRFDWLAPSMFLVGGGATLFLVWMRALFWWFPFHPLGYAMRGSWSMIVLWFPFLVAWFFKALVMRWGGRRLYIATRPIALGMILGEFVAAILWSIISSAASVPGPPILRW